MGAIVKAMVIGAALGVAVVVAAAFVFAMADACRVVRWSDMTVIMCRDRDPILRVWPLPPGWVDVHDPAPPPTTIRVVTHEVSGHSLGVQASRA